MDGDESDAGEHEGGVQVPILTQPKLRKLLPVGKETDWVKRALREEDGFALCGEEGDLEEWLSFGARKEPIKPFTTEWLSDEAVVNLILAGTPGAVPMDSLEGHITSIFPDFATLRVRPAAGFLYKTSVNPDSGEKLPYEVYATRRVWDNLGKRYHPTSGRLKYVAWDAASENPTQKFRDVTKGKHPKEVDHCKFTIRIHEKANAVGIYRYISGSTKSVIVKFVTGACT